MKSTNPYQCHKMHMLVDEYLHHQGFREMFESEFMHVITLLKDGEKSSTIKYVWEVARRVEQDAFKLDLSNHEGTPISDFTAWARAHNVDLTTSQPQTEHINMKKAKDLVEFIQLNLDKIAG